jgi:hypothetical protein
MRKVAVLPPIRDKARVALMKLPVFQGIETGDLIAMARAMPGGKSSRSGSPYGHCASFGNPKPRLGQHLSADHIRRPDFALIVAEGDVLGDGPSVVVEGVCFDNGAGLRNRHIHFTDDLALVVANHH